MACASGDVSTPICSVVMALGTTPLSDADREQSLTHSLTHSLTPFLAPLRALARRHSRVPDDADDLLQDALSALEVSTGRAAEPPSVRELDLPLGLIRRALLPVVVATQAVGTHDPDGHLFVFAQSGAHVRPVGGNKSEHLVVSHPDAPELSA